MPTYRHRSQLDHPPEAVFRWHARPGALDRLLPPWSGATVVERGGGLEEGSRVRLRVRRGPVSLDWVVEHVEVEEGRGFRDRQVSGPLREWDHLHRFIPRDGGGCVVEDEIRWEPPLGAATGPLSRPVVERELHRAFAFRHRRLASDLSRSTTYRDAPLTVGVSGASGLVGTMLTDFLTAAGHRVVPLVRSRAAAGEDGIYWSVAEGEIDAERLEALDALVHLAGEPLFALRWTGAKKRAILESRREGTRLVAEAIAGLDRPPRVLVSASGVHYYGDRGDAIVTEEHGPGEGFLARVCREWERATEPAARAGVRVVTMRSGVVLTPGGGALEQMLRPFRLGLGGRLGSGRQYLSWIDADDHVGLLYHALRRRDVSGALNAAAPNPVPNATFTDALGRVLGRPTLLPVPGPALGVLLGEMGREMLLQGQRVMPEHALATGFRFGFPDVESSLRHQLGREPAPAPSELA